MDPELETRRALSDITDYGGEILFACYRGSIVHNLHQPSEEGGIDDTDLAAVYQMPFGYYIGLDSHHQTSKKARMESVDTGGADSPVDVAAHELRKFVYLLGSGNPSVHLWLWVPEKYRYINTLAGDFLISSREKFISQKNFDATAGYANAQISRLYKKKYQGYMGERRKALVNKYGYDIKNAAHCVRLLLQGIHLLETGRILVELKDSDRSLVLGIKEGKEDLEEVQNLCSILWKEYRAKEELYRDDFPPRVERRDMNKVLTDVFYMTRD